MPLIRPAVPGDLAALVRIEQVFPTDGLSPRALRRHVASANTALAVAEIDGEVAGYCLVLFRSGSVAARLYSLAVAPEQAGNGMGRALLQAAERLAAERGRSELTLEVRENDARAIRLYERSGFRRLKRLPAYYQDGAPALRMVKVIGRSAADAGIEVAVTKQA